MKRHSRNISLLLIGLLAYASNLVAYEPTCETNNERLEKLACLNSVNNDSDWQSISKPSNIKTVNRFSKWLMPANPYARLNNAVFVNTNEFQLHWKMLKAVFPDLFPRINHQGYSWLVARKKPEFNAGEIRERVYRGKTIYTFTIWNNTNLKKSIDSSYNEALTNYRFISQHFALKPLLFEPNDREQRLKSNRWPNDELSVFNDKTIKYEPYSQQTTFGFIKSLSPGEFEQAQDEQTFGYKDILLLDDAPITLEKPVSGTITGSRQADLSHINILSIARGTPNCYIKNARKELKKWDGQLVLFSCNEFNWTIKPATIDEATSWWNQARPQPTSIVASNNQVNTFSLLPALKTQTDSERREATAIYGAKGANLATLYQRTSPELQLKGFLIPATFYNNFMNTQGWEVDLGDGKKWASFATTIKTWVNDEEFNSVILTRQKRLKKLRKAMRKSDVDSTLVKNLINQISDVWGNNTTMVRFRSSSNAEDTLRFSGAGLYDSTSACAADELDSNNDGPSLCDKDKSKERSVSRALKKVWASLWSSRAFEERDWYGINHQDVSMSILVNTRSKNEIANMVVFTGDPDSDNDQIIINAQLGHLSVVSDEAGIHPERIMLKRQSNEFIVTDRLYSSEQKKTPIINDETAITIARHMNTIEKAYPPSTDTANNKKILLDTEWKILEDGRLIIKQVRPFTRKAKLQKHPDVQPN